jgi:hypothetical protein
MLRFKLSYNGRNIDYNNNNNVRRDENSKKIVEKYKSNQYLTLEDVCPIWSKRLRLGLSKKDRDTMARDSKYCLVGEAWGFTGKHAGYYFAPLIPFIGCWTCVQYGNKMGKIARRKVVAANLYSSDLEPIIAEFLKHWNERHRTVTEKLRKEREKKEEM